MNNWMLQLLQTELGRRVQLQILMNVAAAVAGRKRQCLLCLSSEKALAAFARFTAQHLPDDSTLQEQLYAKCYRLGRRLRRWLHITTDEQLTRTVILLYRNIGIDMQGALPGEVCVRHCFFSDHYTPRQCSIASRMDAGIICGLAGQGHFQFCQRITEGKPLCIARLTR